MGFGEEKRRQEGRRLTAGQPVVHAQSWGW